MSSPNTQPFERKPYVPAALSRIVMVQTHARKERLKLTELYRQHFLSVIHVVSNSNETLSTCRSLKAICKPYSRTWQDFQRPVIEIALALLTMLPAAPKNHWFDSYNRTGVEPRMSKYVEPQLAGARRGEWLDMLRHDPGPERLGSSTGMLVCHMDFWLDPHRFARHLSADRIWRLGLGLAGHKQTNIYIRVLSPELNVTRSADPSSSVVQTMHQSDTRPVVGGLAGLDGLSQKRGPVAPIISMSSTTSARLQDGWVWQHTLKGPHDVASFEVRGFFYESHCLAGEALEKDETYEWGFHAKREGLKANNHLPRMRSSWGAFQGTLCAGWTDLYHIPTHAFADFVELGQLYLGHRVFHEVAIPSALNILSNASRHEHEDVVSDCFGCCCCEVPKSSDVEKLLRYYKCGHRLNLADELQQEAFARKLRPREMAKGLDVAE